MIYIVAALLIVVLNLYLAKKRGINPWLVGIGSLFLGIFVTIGLLLHIILTKEPENTTVELNSMRKCPYCAEMIKREAIVCRYCNKEVTPLPTKVGKIIRPSKKNSNFNYNRDKKD